MTTGPLRIDVSVLFLQIGLAIQFLAVWLAAPEVLGAARLVRIEDAFEAAIQRGYSIIARGLFLIFFTLIIAIGSAYIAAQFAPSFLPTVTRLARTLTLALAFNIILWGIPLVRFIRTPLAPSTKLLLISLSFGTLVLIVLYVSLPLADLIARNRFLYCLIPILLPLLIVLSSRFRNSVNRSIARLLRTLANDFEIRRRALVLAATLFSIGLGFQFLATLWP